MAPVAPLPHPADGDLKRVDHIVRRALPADEAVIDAVADDGRTVTVHFRLVLDPVLLTQRVGQLEEALARADLARTVLPMLRLI